VSTPIAEALPDLLPTFLPQQRWFGDKARRIARCEVEDLAPLAGAGDAMVVVSAVDFTVGARQRYGLVVASRPEPGSRPVLGRLGSGGDWLVEATTDPDVAEALLRGFASDGEIPMARDGRLQYADTTAETRRRLATAVPEARALGAEQSNTSLLVGRRFVFKLFRRIDVGENPEVEVGRFLTSQTTFRAMPALEGSLTYVSSGGETATVGVLQQWVESVGDGWRHALAGLEAARDGGATLAALTGDIGQLGAITADFHAALASSPTASAFAPEPLTQDDADAWLGDLRARAADAPALLQRRQGDWPEPTRRLAGDVRTRISAAWDRLAVPAATGPGGFAKIRIHGDYHLGQTLKTATGFAIIDFEGEPAIPIVRRRQKQAALKDVAGMLRSFDYAIETACAERPGAADDLRAAAGLRQAFLERYVEAAAGHGARSIPSGADARERWLAFFELGKALYELEYEINNRPGWVHIPLRGLLRTLDGLDR